MLIKIVELIFPILLPILFPIILFLFKYILPSICESIYKKTKREKKQIIIELIHFPVDLFFIAISYSIPKILEINTLISSLLTEKADNVNALIELTSRFNSNFALLLIMLIILPFCVFGTKRAEKNYFSKNQKGLFGILLPAYGFAIIFICLSIIL